MNFFAQQAHARRHTTQLVILFGLTVVLIILACYFPAVIIANYIDYKRVGMMKYEPTGWRLDVLGYAAAVAGSIILFGSLWKIWQMSGGGAVVAARLGGRVVDPSTTDPDERKLRNVVEEMAIASGIAVPEIFVLNEEKGINAFAAGFSPNDAAIAVTRGCIQTLNRDELQGVIAHEFSHIFNGDMRLNIRLIGLVHGILVIGLIGAGMMRAGAEGSRVRSSRQGGGTLAIIMLGVIIAVIGYIGVFFGRVIKAAVSRQREFLADASAVDFTRNPDGIAGALKKIGGLSRRSILVSPAAEEASHLFFGNGLDEPVLFASLLATHPPIAERIRRIDPSFDGKFPRVEPAGTDYRIPTAGIPTEAAAAAAPLGFQTTTRVDPARVIDQVAAPTIDHLAYGAALLGSLPATLRSAVREPTGAVAAVFALLLDKDEDERNRQIAILRKSAEPAVVEETLRQYPLSAMLFPGLKLPMAELAIAALRGLGPEQYEAFSRNVARLIASDRKVNIFEFALQKLLQRRLAPTFGKVDRQFVRYRALTPLLPDCRTVLSVLARLGSRDAEAARQAFTTAAGRLWKSPPPATGRLDAVAAQAAPATRLASILKAIRRLSVMC